MKRNISRRTFLEFIGIGAVATMLPSCGGTKKAIAPTFNIKGIAPSSIDRIVLSEGLKYDILVKWDDPISNKDRFGFNNDYLAFLPFNKDNPVDGLLWVNHEYTDPMFVSQYVKGTQKTAEQVEKEMYSVGGSIVMLRKTATGWAMVKNDKWNRRITGTTRIPFHWEHPIAGSRSAMGMVGNCAGGVTPWGTVLTCEENYDNFYGETDFETKKWKPGIPDYDWRRYHKNPPEHYGWVVEMEPMSGDAKKLVALGRCAHECATVVELPDKRVVVYTGDDANDQCLYKFISSKTQSLLEGTLYVADTANGRWIPVDYERQPVLKEKFTSQTETLIHLREAADALGGSKLDRPEDIEIDPVTGHVLVSLTNNLPKGNYHGSILKIMETGGKYDALTFQSDTFLTGGESSGFACPDNLAFDPMGNLWFTSDISGSMTNKKEEYMFFKNNGLFVLPRQGPQMGKVVQVASAPIGAEFTGPWFSPGGESLFLSVQHPGEYSPSLNELTSHWPDNGNAIPRPAVIVIQGFAAS